MIVAFRADGQSAAIHKKPFRDNFKTAPDGLTKGWLVEYPWPGPDGTSQAWRTIPGRLVISRHGHVIRRFEATDFWNWNFWADGKQVVYEAGPVHGETDCVRVDVNSGKTLETWPGDCRNRPDDAPAWVKAADGNP
jgi:hypothetical protein